MPFYNIFSKKTETRMQKLNQIKPKIIVDYREKNSLVVSELIHNNCIVEFKPLGVGDYIIKNIIIERKTVSDFLSSMMNKRLIKQIQSLKEIENKLLIIEGIEEYEL